MSSCLNPGFRKCSDGTYLKYIHLGYFDTYEEARDATLNLRPWHFAPDAEAASEPESRFLTRLGIPNTTVETAKEAWRNWSGG